MSALRRLLGPAVFHGRIKAQALRREAGTAAQSAAVRAAPRMYRMADHLSAVPFRDEQMERPEGDLLDDLAAYTGLPPSIVEDLVCRREPVDFRAEWHATPPSLRMDHWFYLSSKTYLFGNAIHFATEAEIDAVAEDVPPGAAILEFGAGAGNLSVALARRGHQVIADEVSALQRDFIRFRVTRHRLEDRVRVLDPWDAPEPASVDVITAFDVLEHLPDGRSVLEGRLLPALRAGGVLIEDSPFDRNVANPMHHEDWGLDAYLAARGMTLESRATAGRRRVWRAAAAS